MSRQSSVAHDLAYLIPAFALSLASLVLLLTLLVVGLGTLIIGIGVAIVAVCLLMSSSFAAENRRLLANWEGHPRPTPHYDSLDSGPGRLLRTLRDRRLWLELLHGAVVALPVRLVIFAVSISWLAAGFGGITYVVWGWFLPPNSGIATVLSSLAGIELPVSAYLASSVLNFVAGAILLLIAPFVIRLLTRLDAALARIFLTHPVPQPRPLQDPTAPNPTNP